jgi:hypothetical protein
METSASGPNGKKKNAGDYADDHPGTTGGRTRCDETTGTGDQLTTGMLPCRLSPPAPLAIEMQPDPATVTADRRLTMIVA